MIPIWRARYAVVKDGIDKRFSKWHDSEDIAIEEAKRLCQEEGVPFTFLVEVGCASLSPIPADFTRAERTSGTR